MSHSRIAALVAVAVVCATAVIAQTVGSGGSAPAPKEYEHHDPVARMKSVCIEQFARSAAKMAYLEAKLQLAPQQQPQWDKWRQAVATGAEKERADCLANLPAAGVRPTALDRDTHMEKMMAVKVESLQAARPALEALYQALTPDQRLVFDRPIHGEHEGHRKDHVPEHEQL